MSDFALDASGFIHNSTIYEHNFECVLSQIIACYNLMKSDNCSVQNNENFIRDEIVIEYLMKNDVRRRIGADYIFYREFLTADNAGRVDIYVATQNIFQDTDAYYTIECKRLDGKNKLNNEYIANGIMRFTNERKYPFYNDTAGMIGFVVEKIDIHKNISAINKLLKQDFTCINTEAPLTHKAIESFEHSYLSKHRVDNATKTIYHLMFDFSDNIVHSCRNEQL
ncbi:MAG: hypothetical protein LBU89_04255 [Fibromonadaceae bacterium]|jgi:hypothetical protein|nr:hypothetical protein [Fibromonadaceae bacterium]